MDFVERVRTLQDLPLAGAIDLSGSDPDDSENCILARALGSRVDAVPGRRPDEEDWQFALMARDRLTARRIGIVMDLEWRADPPAIRLPDAISDVAVSQHQGKVEAGDFGFLRGWWVPIDETEKEWRYFTPSDDIIEGGQWAFPKRG